MCLYNVVNSNDVTSDNLIAKQIGETWKDGPCVTCTCEEFPDDLPKSSCVTTQCASINSHLDFGDFVLEEKVINDQCCPLIERVACKHHEMIYNVRVHFFLYL